MENFAAKGSCITMGGSRDTEVVSTGKPAFSSGNYNTPHNGPKNANDNSLEGYWLSPPN